ncbi:MAG: O-antigen polymerase [Clostridiaceae bacterium]|nr:O-antigen polymerase [Clostridiaceae bacterium]
MNNTKAVFFLTGVLILGLAASWAGMLPVLALIVVAVAVAVLFLDYEKATIIVALYTVFDFFLRSVISHPVLSSLWDEAALLLCVAVWLYKWLVHIKEKPYRRTPLDISIILYMVLGVIFLFIAAPDFIIGVEGLRVVIQYMFWFFVVTQLLKTPEGAKRILNILVISGLLVSLYGIYQFIIAVEIPAHWVDEMEGNVRTRVFSIFTTPNMLAGYLSLIIPVTVGLFFGEKDRMRKLYYGGAIFCMGAALLFTLSRGGWIFCFLSLMVYVWLKNRKFFVPSLLVMAALFIFTVIFVPSVANRILYLLSPEYIASSSKGGRILRAIQGFELFKENFWTGMGLGQFGGSVALSHKLNNTFSMDNYYLKTAVEMGIFGLIALLILMYNTVMWCSRAISKISDEAQKDWARGITSSLAGIVMYNLTENMLEIPLISSYFWMLAGVVMFLAYGRSRIERDIALDSEAAIHRTKETG